MSERISACIDDQDSDIDLKLQKVTDVLTNTALECAPLKKCSKAGKNWSPELNSMSKDSKIAFNQWKLSGRPTDPGNKDLQVSYSGSWLRKKEIQFIER